jgi:hypothetical protein
LDVGIVVVMDDEFEAKEDWLYMDVEEVLLEQSQESISNEKLHWK